MSELKPSDVIEFSTDGMAAPRRDNSLLAKMGFADADRKDPLHDLACRYLAQPEVALCVTHLRLGAAFQEWCRLQQQTPKAQSPEI